MPLSDDAWPAVPAGPLHTTRRNHGQCDAAGPPGRPAGARYPIPRAGSSSGDQLGLEGGQAETPTVDRQGQK